MRFNLIIFCLGTVGSLFSQNSYPSTRTIFFEKNSDQLSLQSQEILDSLILESTNPAEELLLFGHTDADASAAYNMNLSRNRTLAIQNYFFSHNLPNRLHLEWRGEEKPVNANLEINEKALNRRVEIFRNYQTPSNQISQLKKAAEVFVIKSNRDTILTCKEGTQIFVRAGSFNTPNESSEIEIEITEFYKKSDFLLNNLTTTTTSNELLESGGTIEIHANVKGESVELNQGSTLQVIFKDKKENDGMETYYAVEGKGVTKWTTDLPEDSKALEPILISEAYRIRNMDTMEIVTEFIVNIDGLNYKVFKSRKRGHRLSPFQESVTQELLDQKEYVNSIFFSTDRALTVRDLGRINCDRLKRMENTQQLTVEIKSNLIPSLVVKLDSINMIIPFSRREGNVYVFDMVPTNSSFDVIALYIGDQGIFMGQLSNEKIIESPNSSENKRIISMKKYTERELRLAIEQTDRSF